MRALALVLVSCAFALGAAAAASAAPGVRSWPIDEGTTGALVEDHRAPVVHVAIEWPAGTWSAWVRRSHADDGFAIQLYDPDGELRRRSDLLAADLGLGMGNRSATLVLSCLREDLEPALGLVRDLLANRSFDRRELQRRKAEARLAWKSSMKQPAFRLAQEAALLLFRPGDPRRWSWEGPRQVSTDVEALTRARDVVVRLPGRVVGFSGDLTPAQAREAASGLLPPPSEAPEDLAPDFRPLAGAGERPAESTVPLGRLTQVYFGLGRDSLPWDDPDYPAFKIADHVLGGHFYSRLYVALRHEGGETYGAGTHGSGDVVPGPYGLGTFTRVSNAARTEAKLREVLRVFREGGITEQERLDAVGSLRGARAFSRQSPEQVLRRWMRERRLGLHEGFLDDLPERAATVPLAEVNAFIHRWYDPEAFTLVRVAPPSRP